MDPTPFTRLDGSPIGVLVVDDEATLGELLSMVFRHEGWRVEWAQALTMRPTMGLAASASIPAERTGGCVS